MRSSTVLTLLGFGLGTLLIASRRSPRTIREQAIAAQRISAQASERARELAAKWNEEQARLSAIELTSN